MGLLNVIKLANDYNKAKKYLKKNKHVVEDAKKFIEKAESMLKYILDLKQELQNFIGEVEKVIEGLKKIVKAGK